MDDLLGSMIRGSQKRTILCHRGWVVTNGIRVIAQSEMGEHAQAHEVTSGHTLERQEWSDPMRVANGDAGSQNAVTSHIAWVWEWRCTCMYIRTILDTMRFKVMIVMNLSELRNLACFCENSVRTGDLLGSMVRRRQKWTILCCWGWVVICMV